MYVTASAMLFCSMELASEEERGCETSPEFCCESLLFMQPVKRSVPVKMMQAILKNFMVKPPVIVRAEHVTIKNCYRALQQLMQQKLLLLYSL